MDSRFYLSRGSISSSPSLQVKGNGSAVHTVSEPETQYSFFLSAFPSLTSSLLINSLRSSHLLSSASSFLHLQAIITSPLNHSSSVLTCFPVSPQSILFFFVFFFFLLFVFSRTAPTAYGGSQARSRIKSVSAGLHHSHSNARSKPHLRPTPQITATPDP